MLAGLLAYIAQVPPTTKKDFPTSINKIKSIPLRHAQRPISQVILDSVKLASNINLLLPGDSPFSGGAGLSDSLSVSHSLGLSLPSLNGFWHQGHWPWPPCLSSVLPSHCLCQSPPWQPAPAEAVPPALRLFTAVLCLALPE